MQEIQGFFYVHELAISNIDVPPSLIVTFAPSASKIISPPESIVTSVPSAVIVSKAMLPTFVISLSQSLRHRFLRLLAALSYQKIRSYCLLHARETFLCRLVVLLCQRIIWTDFRKKG